MGEEAEDVGGPLPQPGEKPVEKPSAEKKSKNSKKKVTNFAPDTENDKVQLPPAKSIFKLLAPEVDGTDGPSGRSCARSGELLGLPTPSFVLLTSRGMPLHLRPEALATGLQGGARQLWQLPVGDILLRLDGVAASPQASQGCRGFWPHLQGQLTYCPFRNARLNPSVHGGDVVCSVETTGGRRKVGPKELLDAQKVMRVDLVAAPGEEVLLDVAAPRRLHRAVTRAADWLKEILEAKATEPDLSFDWHLLASIQGGNDVKLRQKACEHASKLPIAGVWIGGLGYSEDLASRARVLQAVTSALPAALPRFLPLSSGTPVEVLQAVLLGVDVLEVAYPTKAAQEGIALIFSCDMPAAPEGASAGAAPPGDDEEEALRPLLPPPPPPPQGTTPEAAEQPQQQPQEGGAAAAAPQAAGAAAPPAPPARVARYLQLRSLECREDFGPISETSPVRQYSRAYLYHLLEVRELLGTMLLAQHNLQMYSELFAAIRRHAGQGTFRQFAAWFMKTQTCDPPAEIPIGPGPRKRPRKG